MIVMRGIDLVACAGRKRYASLPVVNRIGAELDQSLAGQHQIIIAQGLIVDPDAALKGVPLRANRTGGVTEESTGESLEYSAMCIADIRWLIVEFKTSLVRAYQTLEVAGCAFAIMAGKAKVRVAVCCPVRLDGIDGPVPPDHCFAFIAKNSRSTNRSSSPEMR